MTNKICDTHSLFTTRLASASHFLLLAACLLCALAPSGAQAQRGGLSKAEQQWLEKYYLPLPAPGAAYGVYPDAQAQAYAQEVFELTNKERVDKGHTVLTRNSHLDAVAQAHAVHMAAENFFEHESPQGMEVFQRIDAAGAPGWRTAGENIAAGYRTPQIAMKEWMDSKGHRKNIRNEGYREIGIGVYYDARTDYGWFWVQVFATFDGRYSISGGSVEGIDWVQPTGGQGNAGGQRYAGQPGSQHAVAQSSASQEPRRESDLQVPAPPAEEAPAAAPLPPLELEAEDDGPDWEAAKPVE